MNTEVMFSHKKNNWATPQAFFDNLDDEFHFTLDPCVVMVSGRKVYGHDPKLIIEMKGSE